MKIDSGRIRAALFVVSCLLVYVVGKSTDTAQREKANYSRKIETSLKQLNRQNFHQSPFSYSVEILPLGISQSGEKLDKALSQHDKLSSVIIWNHTSVPAYTMSATDINGQQKIVNSYLDGYSPFEVESIMVPMYILAQRKQYMLDSELYAGRQEVWQTSRQAFAFPRGDCEDHAILLADWLIDMGYDARVALGDVKGDGHAWVVLFKDGKEYLLESTMKKGLSRNKTYPLASLFPDYHPQFMFNREFFWHNTGSKYTQSYASQWWVKKSKFVKHLKV